METKRHRTEGGEASGQQNGRTARAAVIREVLDWDTLAMFHEPVSEEAVPGYRSVVTHPIDLRTIRARNDAGDYDGDVTAFVEALQLMVSNALTFNAKGTMWHKHAKRLQKGLAAMLDRHHVSAVASAEAGAGASGAGDAEDATYMPTRAAVDSEATLRKEETRKDAEDVVSTLTAMKADMALTQEQLLAKYRGARADEAAKAFEARVGAQGDAGAAAESDDGEDEDVEEDEEEESAWEDSDSAESAEDDDDGDDSKDENAEAGAVDEADA